MTQLLAGLSQVSGPGGGTMVPGGYGGCAGGSLFFGFWWLFAIGVAVLPLYFFIVARHLSQRKGLDCVDDETLEALRSKYFMTQIKALLLGFAAWSPWVLFGAAAIHVFPEGLRLSRSTVGVLVLVGGVLAYVSVVLPRWLACPRCGVEMDHLDGAFRYLRCTRCGFRNR